jgi:hypothetical protein
MWSTSNIMQVQKKGVRINSREVKYDSLSEVLWSEKLMNFIFETKHQLLIQFWLDFRKILIFQIFLEVHPFRLIERNWNSTSFEIKDIQQLIQATVRQYGDWQA